MTDTGECAEKRFAVDVMLGKLAKWLRLLGFDTRISLFSDRERVESFLSEGLVPVTRREKFQKIEGVLFISGDHHFEQLKELLSKLRLDESCLRLFSRCMVCNARLDPITREAAFGAVPDFVFETASDFGRCPQCERVYWPGTHKGRMLEKLSTVTEWKLKPEEG